MSGRGRADGCLASVWVERGGEIQSTTIRWYERLTLTNNRGRAGMAVLMARIAVQQPQSGKVDKKIWEASIL